MNPMTKLIEIKEKMNVYNLDICFASSSHVIVIKKKKRKK